MNTTKTPPPPLVNWDRAETQRHWIGVALIVLLVAGFLYILNSDPETEQSLTNPMYRTDAPAAAGR